MEKDSPSFEDTAWQYLLRIIIHPNSKALHLLIILLIVGRIQVSKPTWFKPGSGYLKQASLLGRHLRPAPLSGKHCLKFSLLISSFELVSGKRPLVTFPPYVMELVKVFHCRICSHPCYLTCEAKTRKQKFGVMISLLIKMVFLKLHATFKKTSLNHLIKCESLMASYEIMPV